MNRFGIFRVKACFKANRWVKVIEKYSFIKFSTSTELSIYSLDAATMRDMAPLISKHRGDISYLSLKGIKDIRLQSTGDILPLAHVQWGASVDKGTLEVIPGYTHMFCVPSNDELALSLADQAIYPG